MKVPESTARARAHPGGSPPNRRDPENSHEEAPEEDIATAKPRSQYGRGRDPDKIEAWYGLSGPSMACETGFLV